MKIFVSYPRSHAEIAAELVARLRADRHQVFIDESSLPPGESYDKQIRESIHRCELFISLFAGDSLRNGTYSRTEMKFAAEKWPNPSNHVLPVALDAGAMDHIPAYLKSVTVMRPEGEIVADVVAEVGKIASRPMRSLLKAGRALAIAAVLLLVAWFVYREFIDGGETGLKVNMAGSMYEKTTRGAEQILAASTPYLAALRDATSGRGHEFGDELHRLLEADKAGPASEEQTPFPLIQLAMVNNTGETVIVDRVRLHVEKSETNREPLPWAISHNPHGSDLYNGRIEFGNNGWGPMNNIVFDFDLVPESALAAAEAASDRRFTLNLDQRASGEQAMASLWGALAAFGEPVDFLRDGDPCGSQELMDRFEAERLKLKRAIGAAPEEPFYAVGELGFDTASGERRTLALKQVVHIVYTCAAVAPAMISLETYDIELLPDGADYDREVSIAWSLEPQASEALDLRVFVERSSFHVMKASIRVNDEWIEAPDVLELEYYMPRDAVWGMNAQPEGEG
jgi:hypothetical protein